jgi:hypothetical protein
VAVFVGLSIFAKDKSDVQPFPRDDKGNVRFQGVVQVEGAKAQELYTLAKLWVAKSFRSAKDVIQLDDPANGVLIAKGSHEEGYGFSTTVWFHYTLTVEVKDGRYRWTLDQLEYDAGAYRTPIEKELTPEGVGVFGRKAVYERFRQFLIGLSHDLEAAMKQPAPNTKGGDF